jgi:CubicO group peptidase (beta-lactamase class C family)
MVDVADLNLANWLEPTHNRLAFRHVRDVLPVEDIPNDPGQLFPLAEALIDPARLTFSRANQQSCTIESFLDETYSDGLLILKGGKIAFERYLNGQSVDDQHIVFSVSKSFVGALVGVLENMGKLDCDAPVSRYVPEIAGSGFAEASVRHLLDMTVSLDFEEAYLDPESSYAKYRRATGWHEPRANENTSSMHEFFRQIGSSGQPNGERFRYLSPNTDLLGWVCERATGSSLAALLSEHIFKPMGAQAGGSITLDRNGSPRAAGGISCTLRDMARFGEYMRRNGKIDDRQVIPEAWVNDIRFNSSADAWRNGDMVSYFANGGYRSQWYIVNDAEGSFFAAGIYGQWIFISPANGVVIAKQASRWVGPATAEIFRFELEALQQFARRTAE